VEIVSFILKNFLHIDSKSVFLSYTV